MGAVLDVAAALLAIMFLSGLYAAVAGRSPYPKALADRLPSVPAKAKDHRLVGGTAIFGAIAVGLNLLNAMTADLGLTIASAAFFTVSFVLYLTANFYDRRDQQVRSGWNRVRGSFR
jgi:uncharacterized membrane protein HdeD (DUF308 family)